MADNAMTLAIPLGEDPAEDLPDDMLLDLAVEAAHDLASTRDLHAVNVRLVEKYPGLKDVDGHYVLDGDGAPISPRVAFFAAEGIAI